MSNTPHHFTCIFNPISNRVNNNYSRSRRCWYNQRNIYLFCLVKKTKIKSTTAQFGLTQQMAGGNILPPEEKLCFWHLFVIELTPKKLTFPKYLWQSKIIKKRYANFILSLDFTCRNQLQQTLHVCQFRQVCVSCKLLYLVSSLLLNWHVIR